MRRKQTSAGRQAIPDKPQQPLAEPVIQLPKPKPRIIEENGRRYRIEDLDGREFRLLLNRHVGIDWQSMKPEKIVEYAKAYCRHYKITKKHELNKRNSGLYQALDLRSLLNQVFPRETERTEILDGVEFRLPLNGHQDIDWQSMSDEEILNYAEAYCKEHAITRLDELADEKKRYMGLYFILRRRKFKDKIFPKEKEKIEVLGGVEFRLLLDKKRIRWQSMKPEKIVEYAKAYCRHYKITKKHELNKRNSGLYQALDLRSLLNQVFPRETERTEILDGVEFRLPLDNKECISWQSMTDKGILEYAKAYCKHHGITKPSKLSKKGGLCLALRSRSLIDQVFPKEGTLAGLADALESFE